MFLDTDAFRCHTVYIPYRNTRSNRIYCSSCKGRTTRHLRLMPTLFPIRQASQASISPHWVLLHSPRSPTHMHRPRVVLILHPDRTTLHLPLIIPPSRRSDPLPRLLSMPSILRRHLGVSHPPATIEGIIHMALHRVSLIRFGPASKREIAKPLFQASMNLP